MSRLIALVAALVLAWLAVPAVADAAPAPDSWTHTYTYDSADNSSPATTPASQRSPPGFGSASTTTYDIVTLWSRGAAVRHVGATAEAPQTRNAVAAPARAARASGVTQEQGGRADGELLSVGPSNVAAKTAPEIKAAVHGNSRLSPKTAYLYRLSDDSGNYLKTGITSNPGSRYTQKFLLDKRLDFLTSGSRSNMLNLERFIVERDPGPLNLERWAGSFAGDVP